MCFELDAVCVRHWGFEVSIRVVTEKVRVAAMQVAGVGGERQGPGPS